MSALTQGKPGEGYLVTLGDSMKDHVSWAGAIMAYERSKRQRAREAGGMSNRATR